MLSGANDLRSIWRWGRRLTPKGLAMLGIDRGRAPCHATYHYVFRAIPAADLERAPGAAVRLDRSLGHVAIVKGNQPDLQAEIARRFGDGSPLKARQPPGPE
jgi:hypothetical protein